MSTVRDKAVIALFCFFAYQFVINKSYRPPTSIGIYGYPLLLIQVIRIIGGFPKKHNDAPNDEVEKPPPSTEDIISELQIKFDFLRGIWARRRRSQ